MIKTNFTVGGHDWQKVNLVTLVSKGCSTYDLYRCSRCGLEAKRYRLNELVVDERYRNKLAHCSSVGKPKQLQIIECRAVGPQFANLTPGSVHDIIAPPEGNDRKRGEWVMGVGEPVKVLFDEFNYIKE